MSLAFAPTGQQTMSQRDVDQFLTEARMAPTNKSPRVLGINQLPLMRAKNNGYPIDMYHPVHDMRKALKEEEELALAGMGYSRQYTRKEYPKAMFRRNMDPKFEPAFDAASTLQTNIGFVEERTVRSADEEKALRAMKPKANQSIWFEKVTDIPEIEDGPTEDPKVTIARLEGELAGVKAKTKESK